MATSSSSSAGEQGRRHYFASFDVTPQVFHSTPAAIAFVNLKPLVPGHVLVVPSKSDETATAKVQGRLSDLTAQEMGRLFEVVHRVCAVIERAFGAEALTVSVQDGPVAGQTVPHVHVHILPRRTHDFSPNDAIYPLLERFGFELADVHRAHTAAGAVGAEAEQGPTTTAAASGPDNEDRPPRTVEQMRAEAEWLSTFFREGEQSE